PLPAFSEFRQACRHRGGVETTEGNVPRASFLGYDEAECEYFTLNQLHARVHSGHEIVSSMFVIPYPPGFPILVPGQVISEEIVKFMQALDVKEIHGYRPELGLRVFTKRALEKMAQRMTAEQQPAVAIAAPMQQTQVAS